MVRAETLHRLLILSILIGLVFSFYSAYETLVPAARGVCTVNPGVSCTAVDQSAYSHVGPIKLYWVGIIGFLLLLVLEVLLFRSYEERYLNVLLIVSGIGVATAVVLGAIEVFLIHSICPICLGAYISGVAVFFVTLKLYRLRHEDTDETPGSPKPTPAD